MKARCEYCGKVIEIKTMDDIQAHRDVCKPFQEMMEIVRADIGKRKTVLEEL